MTLPRRRLATVLAVVLVVTVSATPTASVPLEQRADPIGPSGSGQNLVSGADPVTNISNVHESGVTGEGVRVGVIGRGFHAERAGLANHVGDSREFADGPRLRVDGTGNHDTAVAEIVARTAPDAELYLASVGSHAEPEEYAAAVDWLLDRDVDVIVDAASYFPPSGAAAEQLNDVATRATARGAVFVTSAGNYADRHWRGSTTGAGWVAFDDGIQANPLGNGTVEGPVTLRLYWQSGADYDLYLYRYRENAPDPVVAKSTRRQRGVGDHGEAIDTTLPPGRYYVAIHGRANVSGETRIDLFSATQELRYTVADGSMVAPATADHVIAVGATTGTGSLRQYSSSGAALDVTAPDGTQTRASGRFYGTSAAAPIVAGTVALMESRHGNLSPAEAEQILESTAIRQDGRLRIQPTAAIAAAGLTHATPVTDEMTIATPVHASANRTGTGNETAAGSARFPPVTVP